MKITEFRIELCNFFIKKTGIKECAGTPSKVPYHSWINKKNDRLYIRLQSYHLPVNFLSTSYLILTIFPKSIVKVVILPPRRNSVKKLWDWSFKNKKLSERSEFFLFSARIIILAYLSAAASFFCFSFLRKKEKESIQKWNPLCKIGENLLHTSSVPPPYQVRTNSTNSIENWKLKMENWCQTVTLSSTFTKTIVK